MVVNVLRLAVLACSPLPAMTAAEPVILELSFFTSDRSNIYQCQIKPFVDAVNADAQS